MARNISLCLPFFFSMIHWITGRAGAGKTYHANRLAEQLRAEGKPVLILDGDEVRDKIRDPGYADGARLEHIMMIAGIAEIAEAQGIEVIIALVSPKREWRNMARERFRESRLIYIPGGKLWPGTTYEEPTADELQHRTS